MMRFSENVAVVIRELEKRVKRFLGTNNVTGEAKEEAMQRLLFSRATMQNTKVAEPSRLFETFLS
jgi:hypothetical protein